MRNCKSPCRAICEDFQKGCQPRITSNCAYLPSMNGDADCLYKSLSEELTIKTEPTELITTTFPAESSADTTVESTKNLELNPQQKTPQQNLKKRP